MSDEDRWLRDEAIDAEAHEKLSKEFRTLKDKTVVAMLKVMKKELDNGNVVMDEHIESDVTYELNVCLTNFLNEVQESREEDTKEEVPE